MCGMPHALKVYEQLLRKLDDVDVAITWVTKVQHLCHHRHWKFESVDLHSTTSSELCTSALKKGGGGNTKQKQNTNKSNAVRTVL